MTIRTATKDDIPAMAELLHELFAIETDFTPDFALQSAGLALLMEAEHAEIFVAEHNGQVIGMCTVQIMISTAMGQKIGKVEDVVVDIEHRGQDIGASLLRNLEQWASKQQLGRLQLMADRDNNPALGFYRKQGWTKTKLEVWMKHI